MGDPGVRDRAAQDRHVQHAGQHDVVGPVGPAGDQPGVLLAAAGRADLGCVWSLRLGCDRHDAHRSAGRRAWRPPRPSIGPDDVLVAGAPAQVALDPFADLGLARVRVLAEQVDRRHDHAGRAEAALQRVALVERLLHRVQRAVRRGEALDRGHLAAVGLHREHRAALHAHAVEQDRAGAAVAGVAADDGADLAERVAQMVDEQGAGCDVVVVTNAVHGDADRRHRGLRQPR